MTQNYELYDEFDGYEPDWEQFERYPRDSKRDEAREKLQKFFQEKSKDVFYIRQLQVIHEEQFFHWITAYAVNELIKEKTLGSETVPLWGPQERTRVKFVFHGSHRYYKRQIGRSLEVIRAYADETVARACGRQAEVLFLNGLATKGFIPKGENTNEYKGRKWTRTGHDLDFIIEKDNVTYGCEVKNTFDYIDRAELYTKLDMCEYLRVRPLFIMRFAPKSYINDIYEWGGFSLLFKVQVHPFGSGELVEKIKKVLDMPVDCPRAIPEGIIGRFVRWHNKECV